MNVPYEIRLPKNGYTQIQVVHESSQVDNMLKGTGKIHLRVGKHGGGRIYISSNVTQDSQFPFTDKEKVHVKIENGKLIVESQKI